MRHKGQFSWEIKGRTLQDATGQAFLPVLLQAGRAGDTTRRGRILFKKELVI